MHCFKFTRGGGMKYLAFVLTFAFAFSALADITVTQKLTKNQKTWTVACTVAGMTEAGVESLKLRLNYGMEPDETVPETLDKTVDYNGTITADGDYNFTLEFATFTNYVTYAVSALNAANDTVLATTADASSWVEDAAVYLWKGGEGRWEDPEMWEQKITTFSVTNGYPIRGSRAYFPIGGSTVLVSRAECASEINIGRNEPKLNASGGSTSTYVTKVSGEFYVSFIGEGSTAELSIVTGLNAANIANVQTSRSHLREITFDNIKVECKSRLMPVGIVTLKLLNGTYFDAGGKDIPTQESFRLEVDADSTFKTQGNAKFGEKGKWIVEGTMLLLGITGNAGLPEIEDIGEIVFKGKKPAIRGKQFYTYQQSAWKYTRPFICSFEIPEGGYEEAPIQYTSGGNTFSEFARTGTNIIFNVLSSSRVSKSAKKLEVPIVDWQWTTGINTNKIFFGTVPNPATDYFYFLPKNTAAPQQIWLHIVPQTGFRVIIR